MVSLVERYVASMVLSGAGDAIGFRNGSWEFCDSGPVIHDELERMGGLKHVKVDLPQWRVSDDTVMHLATGEALVKHADSTEREALWRELAVKYKESMNDMQGRAAGVTCSGSCWSLNPQKPKGYQLPFNPRGGGCGAAMRAMCIGLRYPSEETLSDLIAVSVESGWMTHHHPTGYLGALAAALFVSYSIQGKPLPEWGAGLMSTLPKAMQYVESQGRYVEENKQAWHFFSERWQEYLKLRGIADGQGEPRFPDQYDAWARDEFYEHISLSGCGGASGHDAPMIAYDALLGSGGSWEELALRGMLHGGDSDSTAVIAAACHGAMHGFPGVPPANFKRLEYRDRLASLGVELYNLSHPAEHVATEQAIALLTLAVAKKA